MSRNVTIRRSSKNLRFGTIASAAPVAGETQSPHRLKTRVLYKVATKKASEW